MTANTTMAAVVLTRNEERNIRDCLETLRWVDDLVVLDSGSTDRTLELAESAGARAVVHPLSPFDFSVQRNYALQHCGISAEWVLFIDADERVPSSLHDAIAATLDSAPPDLVAFRLAPKFMFMGKWLRRVCRYPVWHDRLVRREQVRYVGVGPPDVLDAPENAIGYIHEPYIHYGFNNGVSGWFSKHNTYSTNVAEQAIRVLDDGVSPDASFANPRALSLSRYPFLGAAARFAYALFAHGGILDGYPGILYAGMLAVHQFMIGVKVAELRRRRRNLPV